MIDADAVERPVDDSDLRYFWRRGDGEWSEKDAEFWLRWREDRRTCPRLCQGEEMKAEVL